MGLWSVGMSAAATEDIAKSLESWDNNVEKFVGSNKNIKKEL
jgi:hypothetical protein